ncbi:MAG: ABC transporter substrate-binding protein, partial [Pseudomonadota bacterium]
PSGAQGFWFNLRRPKFEDIRVRQAIGKLFNFEWSNETLFYGLYGRTDSFWENSDMQAAGVPEGAELAFLEEYRDQLDPAIFTEPAFEPFISSTRVLDRAALREASALLDEAGWEVADDGLRRNAEGETLRVEIVDDSPAFERIANPFVENMRRAGIDAVWNRIDSAQMQQRQEEFDYDIAIARFVLGLSPSAELRTIFGSSAADRPGSFNLSGVADPVVDDMIGRIISADSREVLTARVKALDRVLRAKHIWVPQWTKGAHWLAYWDVFGRPDIKPPFARGDDYWWWDEEKYQALQAQGALR